jgi:hypothetical protein
MRRSCEPLRAAPVMLLVAAVAGATGGEVAGRVVRYESDRLTVRLAGAPVGEVLDDLARQAGAEIRGTVTNPRDISVEFEDVPLSDALHRLLGDQNFALVYGEDGRLRAVKLLGGPQGPPSPGGPASLASTGPAGVPPAKTYDVVGTLTGLVMSHPPVPVSGRLAQALGSSSASLQQLIDAGLRHQDASVRSEAMRQSLRVIEAEPEFHTAALDALKGMGDADIGNLLRGVAGANAEEVATHVASQARGTELRIKAAGVLRELRARGRPPG